MTSVVIGINWLFQKVLLLSELSANDYAKILFIRFSLRDPRNTLCDLKEFLSKIRTSFELTFHPKFVSPYRD